MSDQLANIEGDVKEILSILKKKSDKILSSKEIQKVLDLSYSAFHHRIPLLKKYGLYKDGQYKMSEINLNEYLKDKKEGKVK